MIFKETLENGLRIIGEPMNQYRSVSIGIWVGTGSVFEGGGEGGASHFIEHMLFKGTHNRTASDIAAQMDGIGGNINAFTAKECTCYYAKVLDEHLPLAVDMLSDIMLNSSFDDKDIEKEKGVVCEEILMVADNPEDLAHEKLCSIIYENDPLSRPILGTQDSVRAFSREGLLSYMRGHYNPNNMVISCAGNFERERLVELVSRYFGECEAGERILPYNHRLAGGRRVACIDKDVEQVHICLGMPGFAIDAPEQYPLIVLNNALGGSMSSRLFQSIREERGLAYSVYSYPSFYRSTGYFTLYAGTGEKQAEQVTEMMLKELSNIREQGITKAEFERSKEQMKGSFLLGQEGTSGRSNAIGKSELLRGAIYSEDEILERIERITLSDVTDILPKVIDFSGIAAAFVGRIGDRAGSLEQMIPKE